MAIEAWGISSCATCKRLRAFEQMALDLLGVASDKTAPLVDEVRRVHEEVITDHVLWHADHA